MVGIGVPCGPLTEFALQIAPASVPLFAHLEFGIDIAFVVGGIVFLYLGAEALVASASKLALGFGLDAALIGVTIVAFATTTPELFVALLSTLFTTEGGSKLSLGAIIGSNIANIGLVLGISSLIRPMDVDGTIIRRHVPFMIIAAAVLIGLGLDNTIGRIDGVLFLGVLVVFSYLLYRGSQKGEIDPEDLEMDEVDEVETDSALTVKNVVLLVVGLGLLFLGSRSLIIGGKELLSRWVGKRVIGLTILAFGTSLPELAASVVSAIRDKAAFSIGNVVGSNIYNILAVLGVVALFTPLTVSKRTIGFDFPALVFFTAAIVAILIHNRDLSRWNGGALVGAYGVFFVLLVGLV